MLIVFHREGKAQFQEVQLRTSVEATCGESAIAGGLPGWRSFEANKSHNIINDCPSGVHLKTKAPHSHLRDPALPGAQDCG
jgi:hypothetical protein